MKISEIDTETVYFWDRSNDWGQSIRSGFDRAPVKRINTERYDRLGKWNHTYIKSPKGRYIAVNRMEDDGASSVTYVLASQVRTTYDEMKAIHHKHEQARRSVAEQRARDIEQANDRADALRDRLADLGADRLIHVKVINTETWAHGSVQVSVQFSEFTGEGDLAALLDLIEAR